MLSRLRPLFAVVGAALCLSACGGSSGSTPTYVAPGPGPGPNPTPPPPASVSVSPSSLAFTGPTDTPQSFTLSSTTPNAPAPTVNPYGCSGVVTLSPPSSSTLPATYTVTPQGNGVCTFVATIGNRSATLGITVGGATGGTFTSTASPLTFTVGGPAQTFTATATSGTVTADTTSCNGTVSVTPSGGPSPQTFTITPGTAGSCTLSIVDGAHALLVPIVVNPSSTPSSAVFVSPSALSFASPYDAPQQVSITAQGSYGNITIDESSCIAPSAKIAYLTFNGVPPGQAVTPPVTATVTPYGTGGYNVPGTGSCTINFVSSTGAAPASITVVVNR
jgi:hypothetical protein